MGLFRSKEEVNQAFKNLLNSRNEILNEQKLQSNLWEHIKDEFFFDVTGETILKDDSTHILIIKMDNSIIVIGYLHMKEIYDPNSISHNDQTFEQILKLNYNLRNLSKEKEIEVFKIIIVTTFKISENIKSNFSKLPSDLSYFYLSTKKNNDEKRQYEMRLDNDIIGMIKGDTITDSILDYMKKIDRNNNGFWSCDICGGNQDTGCLYYDPSECPKFT